MLYHQNPCGAMIVDNRTIWDKVRGILIDAGWTLLMIVCGALAFILFAISFWAWKDVM